MKTFKQYLMEARKQYKISIKLCFKPTDEDVDKIEAALNQFELVSASKPRSLPIQKSDRHFPDMVAPEVYVMEVVLNYPATTDQVRVAILNNTRIPQAKFAVASTEWEASMTEEETNIQKNSDKALLLSPLEDTHVDVEGVYGDKYNEKLVHNSKSGKINVKNSPKKAETTNDAPQGKKSPVGSTKNTLPNVSSFFK